MKRWCRWAKGRDVENASVSCRTAAVTSAGSGLGRLMSGGIALSIILLGSTTCGTGSTEALAERLVTALAQRGISWIAARDPSDSHRVVAAMRFGRGQLTVVAGVTEAPQVTAWLREQQYESVYRVLSAAPSPRAGYILHDLNGLGLRPGRQVGEAFDMYNPSGGRQVSFDGDWASQQLSEAEYCMAFEHAEAAYRRALTLLFSALVPASA